MDQAEYTNLERVERAHWYYAGKRELVRLWLERYGALGKDRLLLDCGAGTGAFAREMAADCQVRVLDDYEASLAILAGRFRPEQVVRGSCQAIPLADASVDVLTALDVLEHLPDDAAAALEFQRVLRPGGVLVVTVPAMMSLWSDWDAALHHRRRYRREELLRLFPAEAWTEIHCNYTNVAVFPLVWLIRRFRRSRSGRRAEDVLPPAWINALLRRVFVATGSIRSIRFPAGVSLILVARKR
jgi:ubiquinone/menaquinone biosynthesis C-methylase UbiE